MATTDLHEIAYRRVPGSHDGHLFVLRVPADLWVFADHFPSRPILPAFVQLDAVLQRVQRLWPSLRAPLCAPWLKFTRTITPGDEVELSLTRRGGTSTVAIRISVGGQPCLSGKLEFSRPACDA